MLERKAESSPKTDREKKRKEEIIEMAMDEAEDFITEFNLGERLGLREDQLTLFKFHFARYYLLKTTSELAYLLRRPTAEVALKIPFLRNILLRAELHNRLVDEAAEELAGKAGEQALSIRKFAENEVTHVIESIDVRLPETNKLINLLATENDQLTRELTDSLLGTIGLPSAIQNVANLLSTVYVGWEQEKSKDKERLNLHFRVQEVLTAIKIR